MKILICGDVHFSQYSSIVRNREDKYSQRLINCINTVNFVEDTAVTQEVDKIIYLGDFFDTVNLTAEELTAITECNWSNIEKVFIVGNHEIATSDDTISSAHILKLIKNSTVIDKLTYDNSLIYIPYITDKELYSSICKEIIEYPNPLKIVFSHNDIKGLQMGKFISKEGFDIEDIDGCCNLWFNGHLHNGSIITKHLINVGNITGQNFNEDSFKYKHQLYLLDTNTLQYETIENPYAFNFYKVEVNSIESIEKLLNTIKDNAVISIKCSDTISKELRQRLDNCSRIISYRLNIVITTQKETTINEIISSDHIKQFYDYVMSESDDETIINELSRLCT